MRLIGIGLLAFLLAGLALLLARSDMVGQSFRAARTLIDGPQLRFETPMAAEAQRGANQAIILRAGPSAPLILSGLPAYQGAVFHMPIDARPTSGYLQIDATSQVLDGVEGVLRISIDNTRRAEVLLHPGEAVRAVRIELTSADIARAQLVVSFSLQGTGANLVCTNDHSVEAVVEIETTSAVFLSLDGPLETPRDLVAAWGDQLRIAWSGEPSGLLQAVAATRAGMTPLMVPEMGLSPNEVEGVLAAAQTAIAPPDYAWSEATAPASGLYGLRRFQHSHTWRIRYDFDRAEHANLPAVLELAMVLPAHPLGADWQITITQNDRLLSHLTGAAAQTKVNGRIAIPADPGPRHTIEITLTSAFLREGECNDGPELLAEILPETRIVPSEQMSQDPIRALTLALRETGAIGLASPHDLTAAEANVAADLLAVLLPTDRMALADETNQTLAVLPRGSALPDSLHPGQWLVFRDADGNLAAQPSEAFVGRESPAVSVLVDLLEAGS